MTEAADQIRDQRRHFAQPGGSHDRLVRVLAMVLPGAVGMIAAVMILAPLSPRGEISFLLDRNRVAVTKNRLQVSEAVYKGVDDQGRAFSVSADNAVQASAAEPIVRMDRLSAQIQMADGPARIEAVDGTYDYSRQQVNVAGAVNFTGADNYHMTTRGVSVDLRTRQVAGTGGVEGAIPAGTFRADRIFADLQERTITLDGNARLRMVPGKLRMP